MGVEGVEGAVAPVVFDDDIAAVVAGGAGVIDVDDASGGDGADFIERSAIAGAAEPPNRKAS